MADSIGVSNLLLSVGAATGNITFMTGTWDTSSNVANRQILHEYVGTDVKGAYIQDFSFSIDPEFWPISKELGVLSTTIIGYSGDNYVLNYTSGSGASITGQITSDGYLTVTLAWASSDNLIIGPNMNYKQKPTLIFVFT